MSNLIENWLPVVGYEGLYSVSDLGRVKSHWYSNPRILAPSVTRDGYLKVVLSGHNGRKNSTIHTLVMGSHFGRRPRGLDISHKDGDKCNNLLSNLEYLSHKENINKKHEHGTTARGESNGNSNLNEIKVCAMRLLHSTGNYTYTYIGNMFNIDKATANRAINNKTWSHI